MSRRGGCTRSPADTWPASAAAEHAGRTDTSTTQPVADPGIWKKGRRIWGPGEAVQFLLI